MGHNSVMLLGHCLEFTSWCWPWFWLRPPTNHVVPQCQSSSTVLGQWWSRSYDWQPHHYSLCREGIVTILSQVMQAPCGRLCCYILCSHYSNEIVSVPISCKHFGPELVSCLSCMLSTLYPGEPNPRGRMNICWWIQYTCNSGSGRHREWFMHIWMYRLTWLCSPHGFNIDDDLLVLHMATCSAHWVFFVYVSNKDCEAVGWMWARQWFHSRVSDIMRGIWVIFENRMVGKHWNLVLSPLLEVV